MFEYHFTLLCGTDEGSYYFHNDKYLSLIGESNSKDRPDRWENILCLSITLHFYVEPMRDRITFTIF